MSGALNIPEILLQIIGYHKYDRPSLRSIIQVNRQWFDCGVPLFWRCCSLKAIVSVPVHRRHRYAPFIRTLSVSANGDKHGVIPENLPQLNVSSLWLDNYNHELYGIQRLCQFMQAGLQCLILDDCLLDSPLADHLAESCPELRHIGLESCIVKAPFSIHKFLDSIASLQGINIGDPYSQLNTNEIFMSLAGRKDFKGLAFRETIEKPPLFGACTGIENPFPALEYAYLSIRSKTVTPLVDMIQNIRGTLNLVFDTPGHSVLLPICRLSKLRKLEVHLPRGCCPSKDDIMVLSRLGFLEHLDIYSNINFNAYRKITSNTLGVTDRDFGCLISCLPRLRFFKMIINWSLSTACLASLAKYCPHLVYIYTFLTVEFNQFHALFPADSEPRFPHLLEFYMDRIEWYHLLPDIHNRSEFVHNFATLLDYHMPSLQQCIHNRGYDYESMEIIEAMKYLPSVMECPLPQAPTDPTGQLHPGSWAHLDRRSSIVSYNR